MTTLRVVQLTNEQFAVQVKRKFLSPWEFCEGRGEGTIKYGRTWSSIAEYVIKYCVVDTEEEAMMTLNKTIEAIKEEVGASIKILRVIKRVRV